MKLLTVIVAATALVGASAAASAAHYRGHVYPYGSYASAYGPYGSYAGPYGNFNDCRIDWNERSDIVIQDRMYQRSQGREC